MTYDLATTSLIQYDSTTRAFLFDGNDSSDAGVYAVTVSVLDVNLVPTGVNFVFTLTVTEPCSTSTLSWMPTTFSSPALNYVLSKPAEVISWADTDITKSVTSNVDCGPLVYTYTNPTPSAIDPIFDISIDKQLTVLSLDLSKA